MVEIGEVHKIDSANRATVRFPRKIACENCRMCFKPKDEMYAELVVKNTLQAKVGDKVSVKMGSQMVLVSSFIVYLAPVIVVAIALFLTRSLDELVSFAISIGALVASYIAISILDNWIKYNSKFAPQMAQIIQEDKDVKECIENNG